MDLFSQHSPYSTYSFASIHIYVPFHVPSVARKIKHTLNVLHRDYIKMCCMHSVNSSPPKKPQNVALCIYYICILKKVCDLRV